MMGQQNEQKENGNRTKRIAKNSFVLFARILFITLINLFSLRFILKGLGKTDYGIYNVIAGVVLASSFIVPVLAISIQRFFSYAIGKQDRQKLREIFSVSVNIICVLSLIILLSLEIGGIWFIDNKMSIPADRIFVAHIIFQFTIFSFILSLFQIPYTAAIFSNEDMGLYALMSSIDCALKFVVALLIVYSTIDNLIFYGGWLFIVAVIMFLFYAIVCRRRYSECHYQIVRGRNAYKELLSFSGWTLYGAIAATGLLQGSNIILNLFFGPLANAAYGVALTIYNAFNSLNNSIVLSFRPAMIQSYAEGNYEYLNKLFLLSNKALYYLLLAASLPVLFCMNIILDLWLDDFSDTTVVFCRLFIIYGICIAMHNPVTTIVQATGKIKFYSLCVDSITILNIPLAYCLLRFGLPAESVFYSMIGLCFLAQCVRVLCLKHLYQPFQLARYVRNFVLPAIVVTILSAFAVGFMYDSIAHDILRFVVVLFAAPSVALLLAVIFGVTKAERKSVIEVIKKKIRR